MEDLKLQQYTKSYPAGTILFLENDPGEHMYVIQSGTVKIFRTVGETEIILALLGSGEFFGEMALLERQPRSASAEIINDANLIEVGKETFEQIIKRNSEIALRIMRKLSARVREADQRIQTLMLESGIGRFLETLRAMLVNGMPEGDMYRIPPSMTCTLPQQAGLSLPASESLLEKLEHAGIVKRQSDTSLLIANTAVLNDYTEYLDLKQKFDPLTASELSHISGLPENEVHNVLQRILEQHMSDNSQANTHELALYRRYLQYKKRFEYYTP